MQPVSYDNLEQLTPCYLGYEERRREYADLLGVESSNASKDFHAAIRQLNRESALGLSAPEESIIGLIINEEQANKRFSGNRFIHPQRGGNTAEHPIFLALKIDAARDAAGFGPEQFNALPDEKRLAAAKFFQRQHVTGLLHDTGELIDISYSDQKAVGASFKEPEEERLVAPFKIRLASYAISAGDPSLYVSKIALARRRIQQVKDALFEQAKNHEISGDDFVRGVGHEIGTIINETEAEIARQYGDITRTMKPEYLSACDTLCDVFEAAEGPDAEAKIGVMFDKLQGDAHFRHFAGRSLEPEDKTPATLMETIFPHGEALCYHMASSKDVISMITYSQKSIVQAFAALDAMPDGAAKEVATETTRQAAGMILRNHIRILQKSPPVIDITGRDDQAVVPTSDAVLQEQQFASRIATVRALTADWKDQRKKQAGPIWPVKEITGTIDTKTLIAVLDKAATLIEAGQWTPQSLPIGLGTLPDELHIHRNDMVRCSAKYPLEVASAYAATDIAL